MRSAGAELALEPVTTTRLERLYERSVSTGVAAGRRFQPQVRHAIEELANGLLEAEPELRARLAAEAGFGRELYRELLNVLYRILFLLFAEQRGMLAGATPLYDETYSLTHLRALVEEGGVEGRKSDLWEGLKATFTAFSSPETGRPSRCLPLQRPALRRHAYSASEHGPLLLTGTCSRPCASSRPSCSTAA